MTILYGINNCDTVKKALKWLSNQQISVEFYDFKQQPLTIELLKKFISLSTWPQLINKRSTTYRHLPDDIKDNLLTNDELAFKTVLAQPTLLKRPLLLHKNKLYLGFNESTYQTVFN
jgi:arsenate reductase